jgi:hypothetical protein
MPENPDQEWRRLTENYAEMYDEQLLDLAASFNDLTDMAKTVLRDEVRKRGLGDPLSPDFAALAQGRADAEQALNAAESEAAEKPAVDYTWKVELCECNDSVEASQIAEVLRRAGLDSWVQTPRYAGDMLGPKVMVAADQLEDARAVIANPIPQDIVQTSLEQIPEYTPPVCPACGAADPILLAADPSNSWECEACGKEWSDPVEDHSEAH